ncbi:hypothetical protein DYB26_007403 [Aphanomyces astaci]|uniref:Uncharacterized protein n=1 Tax=Aphanomyces astaci TaxID=112090 RepID=A0A3R6Y5X9_APHAT|nr:hypothetical protein DYB26_007403 [Aphanomyces astaci]
MASSRDTTETAAGAGVGATIGAAAWGLAAPVANAIGFGASGIAAGSTAASMMSSAAIASGWGVAAGSTVAVLQSIGAVGLATPIGLGLVAAGCVVGAIAGGIMALKNQKSAVNATKVHDTSKDDTGEEDEKAWLLVEWFSTAENPKETRFTSERDALEAFKASSSAKKQLFRPNMTCAETIE